MIGTIARVIGSEGIGSAVRRARERIDERIRLSRLLARGMFAKRDTAPVLNVFPFPPAGRFGGAAIQLRRRIDEERALRDVALFYPGVIETSSHARRGPSLNAVTPDLFDDAFLNAVTSALQSTNARAVHFEGAAGIPIGSVLGMAEDVILSVHDFSLFCARPHLIEEPPGEFCHYSTDLDRCHRCLQQSWNVAPDAQSLRRSVARQLLQRARAVIFPSDFLLRQHRELFALPDLSGHVIEPGLQTGSVSSRMGAGRRVAFVGSVTRTKGAHLLPEIVSALSDLDLEWHVFGGGDAALLRLLRRLPRVTVHGYYRAASLPSLLARHEIDLALLPSIWPESYCLTLSECWSAGVPAVAFAHGAIGERIERVGGGWLVPPDEGAAGIANVIRRWSSGELTTAMPSKVASSRDAAVAHVALYRSLGLL
jgi:glycosyltransferase involved in cell wall biosynthesis